MSQNFYMPTDVSTYRRLPTFEELHVVMGGCVVVDRDDFPQATTLAPPGMFDSRFGTETGRAIDDLRYER